MPSTAVGAGKQAVLAAERDRADRALDRVGVDLDPAVVEEDGEAVPGAAPVSTGQVA